MRNVRIIASHRATPFQSTPRNLKKCVGKLADALDVLRHCRVDAHLMQAVLTDILREEMGLLCAEICEFRMPPNPLQLGSRSGDMRSTSFVAY